MKVYIGPYDHWFRPYYWTQCAFRWWYSHETKLNNDEEIDFDKVDALDDWIRKKFSWLRTIERWVNNRTERKVKVRIDYYDTWSMDDTLALIILPMLKQLKEKKHGSPHVDDADVPDELKSTSAPLLSEEDTNMGSTDANWHKRWDWVFDEMIWAFEQMAPDADSKFFEHPENDDLSVESFRNVKFDKEGYTEWQNRKTRGLTLFGKYFEGLWD